MGTVARVQAAGRKAYVVFPDEGAHRRFYRMVRSGGCTWTEQHPLEVDMLPLERILFLKNPPEPHTHATHKSPRIPCKGRH